MGWKAAGGPQGKPPLRGGFAVADPRVRAEAAPPGGAVEAIGANFCQGSRPGSLPGKGLGKVDAGGRQNGAGPLHREKAT